MAAADANQVLRNGGRLYINPSDLNSVPSGLGTELGTVIGAALEFGQLFGRVASEDDSIEGVHYLGHEGAFSAILRARDDDAYEAVFPNWSAGGSTGRPVVLGAGTTPPGAEVASVSLLFVPNKISDLAVYARRAYPEVEAAARVRLAIVSEAVVPAVFSLAPDTSGHTYMLGTLADLALVA